LGSPVVRFVLALALLLAIVVLRAPYRRPGDLFVADGFGYYMYLPSLFIDGDLDFTNQLAHQPGQDQLPFYRTVDRTGLVANPFPVGAAVLWMPFFLATHLVVQGLCALGFDVPANGFGWAYELPMYCASFGYGLIGLRYMRRLAAELWGGRVAAWATGYVLHGSALAAYLFFTPDLSHILSATVIAVLVYRLYRIDRDRVRTLAAWAGVGALLGLTALLRPTNVVGVAAASAWVAGRVFAIRVSPRGTTHWGQLLKCGAACAVVAFVCLLPQLLVWKAVFGAWISMPTGTTYERMNWLRPQLWPFLTSTNHGLYSWTPMLLPATVGLFLAVRRGPAVMTVAVLVLLWGVYFNACIRNWWSEFSFGQRRMVDFSVAFVLGLGYLFGRYPRLLDSAAVHAAGLFLCAFNWLLMVRYFAHGLPESGYVSWYDLTVGTLAYPFRVATTGVGPF
jgi:hypothetical protein